MQIVVLLPQILIMLRGTIYICLIATLFISSCGFQEKHDTLEFNNRVNSINDSLNRMVTQWHDSLDQAMLKKTFIELQNVRISLGEFIANSRLYVANTPPTKSNEKLKNLEDSLLVTQSGKVADIYPAFEQFSALTPKESLDKTKALLFDDLDAMKAQLAAIRIEQTIIEGNVRKKKK